MQTPHAGGNSVGLLQGIGRTTKWVSVVNALSEHLQAEIHREGKIGDKTINWSGLKTY